MQTEYGAGERRFSLGDAAGAARAGEPGSAAQRFLQGWIDVIAPCPWTGHAGYGRHRRLKALKARPQKLYTDEQRRRRDESPWTIVQGVLAPLQFLVFLVSLGLVLRYLATGAGYEIATLSVIVKTLVLYTIMVTGAVWEKVVFDRWLFAPAFFWEDVFSMLVLALHTLYLAAVFAGWGANHHQMAIALAAYAAYVINAGQFVWKLRMARLEAAS